MKNNYRIVILFAVAISAAWSQSQLTLPQALEMAMEKNYAIRVSLNTSDIADNNASLGNAGLLPQLSLSASRSYSQMDNTSSYAGGDPVTVNDAESTGSSVSVGLSGVLFNGGSQVYAYQKLRTGADLGELQTRQVMENTLVSVIQAYYQVSLLQHNVRISRDALEISRERMKLMSERFDLGSAMSIDLLNSEVDMNTDSISVMTAELNLRNARRNLNHLLGREVHTEFMVSSSMDREYSEPYSFWHDQALDRNAELVLKEEQLKSAELDVKLARSSFFPTLTANVSYGMSESESDAGQLSANDSEGLSAGLNLSLDLFTGFRNLNNLQNARIRRRSQNELLQQALSRLETNVQNAWSTFETAVFAEEVESQSLITARLNFERTQELYDLGQITTTQFREAQLNWIRAEYRLVNSQYTAKAAEVELMRLAGRLVPEEM